MESPPSASLLYAVEAPEHGGETSFAGMYAAYDALPQELKRRVEGRVILHDASFNSAGERRLEQRPRWRIPSCGFIRKPAGAASISAAGPTRR
ncbi:MAG: TauD/TfdA family dioxygenase [Gammaproteobacteria bacterium]|nr:TauD/TfdA family dioxygenase [Gammaproteobacteria bacterium]